MTHKSKNKTSSKKRGNKSHDKTFVGILSVVRKGFGYVDTEKNNGIYVESRDMNGAFDGDEVKAKLIKDTGKVKCKIVEILKRNMTTVIGEYQKIDAQSFLHPLSDRISVDFKIKHFSPEITELLNDGDIIVGEILSYGDGKKGPCVYINENLGSPSKNGNDLTIVLRKHNILEEFPFEVESQIIDDNITQEELSKREDYTNLTVVTIDGDDAKDLDDAISLEKSNENYILGVHIADVSHYVKLGSPIDKEAYYRGTSVYLPDRVAPMLPKSISNGLCSLNPNELKLTLSCIMKINEYGEIVDYSIKKSYIKSTERLSYNIVRKMIENEDFENKDKYEYLRDNIERMHSLYKIMRAKRKKNGFVEFDFPETKFVLDENSMPIDVYPYEVSFANEIIEEFMLAANTCVADFAIKNELPFIYRTHGKPDPMKVEALYQALDALGIVYNKLKTPKPNDINVILKNSNDTEFKTAVHQLSLRTMQKAIYTEEPLGHYGLNFKKYCHFTSPIRRYPDLAIHRILSDFLEDKPLKKYQRTVRQIAKTSSEAEVNAFMAEREANDVKKAQFMKNKIGEEFDGYISGMCDFGFFVSLENTVEGFVPLASLNGDYYEYFEKLFMIIGKRKKDVYKMGQRVKIIVDGSDIATGKINFVLKND